MNPFGPAGSGGAHLHICHLAGPLSLGAVARGVVEAMPEWTGLSQWLGEPQASPGFSLVLPS